MKFSYHIAQPIELKVFLQENKYSKKMISAIKQNGALLVNGQSVTVRKLLEKDDLVEVILPSERPSTNLKPFEAPFTVLYEDEYLIAVSKPKHQNCAPSREHPHESLIEQVMAYLNEEMNDHEIITPHIVTRLDRNTSGIVLFAKHGHIHHLMSYAEMDKQYLCICHGKTEQAQAIIAPIARKATSIIEREVNPLGKYAKTSYETFTQCDDYSLCKVVLHTGRTHQIRVHFEYIGHPLVGDSLYGSTQTNVDGQTLVCAMLNFKHPITDERIEIHDALKQNELFKLYESLCEN